MLDGPKSNRAPFSRARVRRSVPGSDSGAPSGADSSAAPVLRSRGRPCFCGDCCLLALCMCISGIGVAAYHPEAARVTHYIAGNSKATGMSMFSVGGNIGFVLGPLVMTALLVVTGLRGTPAIMVPLGVTALLLFLSTRRMSVVREETLIQNKSEERRSDAWGPFLRLTSALTCRSMVFYGLNTFLPLYWIVVLHQSQAAGGVALSVLLLVGLSGTLLGGRLADRYGRRLVVLTALGKMAPSLLLFPLVSSRSPALA